MHAITAEDMAWHQTLIAMMDMVDASRVVVLTMRDGGRIIVFYDENENIIQQSALP